MSIIKIKQPDPAEVLKEARADAQLTIREFCLALVREGILTPAEAVETAKGNWPAPMAGFLDMLTEEQAADAQIEWAAAGVIERNHVFVLTLASWLEMTPEDVDTLFGI